MIRVRLRQCLFSFISVLFFLGSVSTEPMSVSFPEKIMRGVNNYGPYAGTVAAVCGVPYAGLTSSLVVTGSQGLLPLYSPRWQQRLYGDEDVSENIKKLVLEELKKLNIAAWQEIPIKKKNKSNPFFSSSHFDALIVCPTNHGIYVDEAFLAGQTPETQRALIQTALRHYDNNTFEKLVAMKISLEGLKVVVAHMVNQKLQQAFNAPAYQESSTSICVAPKGSLGSRIGKGAMSLALNVAVDMGVFYVGNKIAHALINKYIGLKQRKFDRACVEKNTTLAQQLVPKDFDMEDSAFESQCIVSRALDLEKNRVDPIIDPLIDPLRTQLIVAKRTKNQNAIVGVLVDIGALQERHKDDKIVVLAIKKFFQEARQVHSEVCDPQRGCVIV